MNADCRVFLRKNKNHLIISRYRNRHADFDIAISGADFLFTQDCLAAARRSRAHGVLVLTIFTATREDRKAGHWRLTFGRDSLWLLCGHGARGDVDRTELSYIRGKFGPYREEASPPRKTALTEKVSCR